MQTKLVCDAKRFKRLHLSAKLAGLTIKDTYKAGEEIHVEVSGRDIQNFISLGRYEATVTDEEIAAYAKLLADKKAAAKV